MGGGTGDNSSKGAEGPMPSHMGGDNSSMHADGPMPSHQGGQKMDGSNNHRGYDSHQGKGPKHPGKLASFPPLRLLLSSPLEFYNALESRLYLLYCTQIWPNSTGVWGRLHLYIMFVRLTQLSSATTMPCLAKPYMRIQN